MQRIRLDLEGVALDDEKGRLTALFRYRTAKGIILNLPESVDVLVGWEQLEACGVDLREGTIALHFTEQGASSHKWLHGSQSLQGQWLDRVELTERP